VIAQLAKEQGILTVAVVTKPFVFEGGKRMQAALKGIEDLAQHVDSLITVPNEKLLPVLGKNVAFKAALGASNDVLLGAVQGIADLITHPGMVNVDFADVRTVMSEMGMAMMGNGSARGDDRAVAAAEAAINNPLLEDVNLTGACGLLVNVTAGENLTLQEYSEIGRIVHEFASDDAKVIMGMALDPEMQDEVRVTVVATGLNRNAARHVVRREEQVVAQRPQLVKLKRTGTDDMPVDYLDAAPTTPATRAVAETARTKSEQQQLLDIPAFLRKQAD